MTPDYAFASRWTVARSRDSLWDVFEHLLGTDDPMLWWPSVHVENYDGVTMSLRADSAFGYSLRFRLTNLQVRRPGILTFIAQGDLRGTGVVSFVEAGDMACHLDIAWKVSVDRRWMRRSSWLLRPVFRAGHTLIMRQGQKRLNAWLCGDSPPKSTTGGPGG